MTKTTSIILLCIVTALVLFLGVFSFIPDFQVGEYNVYHSPLSLIQKDGLFTDSIKVSYSVELDEDVDFSSVQKTLNARFRKAFGYYGVDISYDAATGVASIILPKTNNESGSSADHILEHLTKNGKVEILNVNYTSASYAEDSVVLSQDHFKRARVQSYINGETTLYVVRVRLTTEGEDIANSKLVSSTPYTCAVDGSVETWVYYSGSELQITYAGSSESEENANIMASLIKSGTLGATLTEEGAIEEINSGIGWTIFLAVMGAIILASFIFFLVRFKTLGFVGLLNQLLAVVVFVIFAGLVHLEIFNIFAAIGVVLAYCFMTAFTSIVFDRIVKNLNEKSYSWLRHTAFADTNIVSLIAHGALLVLGIILWVIPTVVTAPLGNVLVYGAVLSFIVTFCLNRLCALVVAPLVEQVPAKSKAKK